MVSVAAVEDFIGPLLATLRQSLLIAAIAVAVSVAIVAVMAGWISRPVVRLREIADQITSMNFSDVKNSDTPFEEIQRLQGSMDRMRSALDMFLRFVPKEIVRNLMLTDQKVEVGGARRVVTLLFTDIEGFTTMSKKMTPEQIMTQTSEYFERLSFAIQANRGTIDKFIGDAIMAMWNAPADDENHVDNACRATLTAHQISEELNAELVANGRSLIPTRFGLHTCEALVGNIGARDRMQYTCLGSGVNLAARIEGLNKFFGTRILVSDAVQRDVSSAYLFRRIDIVEAKGTTVPVTIYELLGERDANGAFFVGEAALARAAKYEQAFDFYLHRDFRDALDILSAMADDGPLDTVSMSLRDRCATLLDDPPPSNWRGVTVLDEK